MLESFSHLCSRVAAIHWRDLSDAGIRRNLRRIRERNEDNVDVEGSPFFVDNASVFILCLIVSF